MSELDLKSFIKTLNYCFILLLDETWNNNFVLLFDKTLNH